MIFQKKKSAGKKPALCYSGKIILFNYRNFYIGCAGARVEEHKVFAIGGEGFAKQIAGASGNQLVGWVTERVGFGA